MSTDAIALRPRRGRPRKFIGPSRPVTLTLPENVIQALSALDGDLSRAVVRLAQPAMAKRPHPPAELATFGRRAVIVVNPTPALEKLTGIDLVPLPDGRSLISFDRPRTIAELALVIEDAIADGRLSAGDLATFEAIAGILRTARHSSDLTLLQRSIIVLERRRVPVKAPRSAAKRGRRTREHISHPQRRGGVI